MSDAYGNDTELKLLKLKKAFPEITDDSILLEILLSCDGSLSKTRSVLSEQFEIGESCGKRKFDEESGSFGSKYQSSINHFFDGGSSKNKKLKLEINKSNTKTITLYTKEDIEATIPYVTFHKNFLPPEIADNALRYILQPEHHLKENEFYLFDNKCKSSHKSGIFSNPDPFITNLRTNRVFYDGKEVKNFNSYNNDMGIIQVLIENLMEELNSTRQKLSPFQPTEWKGDVCVVNRYDTKQDHLDWHSDKLTNMGPLPTIASLSLGATREFKLRKNHPFENNPNPILSIPLPHNTLIIMHSGCQEEYKHCVMSSSRPIDGHTISKQVRVNLTYRYFHPRFQTSNLPKCPKCKNSMALRRSFKSVTSRGKYIWMCMGGYLGKNCNGFHWANFNKKDLITDDENDCSEWIAKDDYEKLDYLGRK
ncbi:hypothetical protein PACTADRAFT_48574 [Pachysolen tannophilus NRRL Y-2460]|uniref:Fe2OG dioxygenase domain-containing protein n=1 Tax=Pachysolen tannophilus NRRL Y-2460 TaxID=669874 RepID=A0A1E4TYC6_PACTA|nr:hypothetical protein PACTADRAFT_48574 [Pachysolen tannophilus NRRL Y-2460]